MTSSSCANIQHKDHGHAYSRVLARQFESLLGPLLDPPRIDGVPYALQRSGPVRCLMTTAGVRGPAHVQARLSVLAMRSSAYRRNAPVRQACIDYQRNVAHTCHCITAAFKETRLVVQIPP